MRGCQIHTTPNGRHSGKGRVLLQQNVSPLSGTPLSGSFGEARRRGSKSLPCSFATQMPVAFGMTDMKMCERDSGEGRDLVLPLPRLRRGGATAPGRSLRLADCLPPRKRRIDGCWLTDHGWSAATDHDDPRGRHSKKVNATSKNLLTAFLLCSLHGPSSGNQGPVHDDEPGC